jgi:hypothetical protein
MTAVAESLSRLIDSVRLTWNETLPIKPAVRQVTYRSSPDDSFLLQQCPGIYKQWFETGQDSRLVGHYRRNFDNYWEATDPAERTDRFQLLILTAQSALRLAATNRITPRLLDEAGEIVSGQLEQKQLNLAVEELHRYQKT